MLTADMLTFTNSNSTIETLEKGVKYCSKLTIKHQNDVSDVILLFALLSFYC